MSKKKTKVYSLGNIQEQEIRLRDIPSAVTLGDLCLNVSDANKIMIAINEQEYTKAFDLAKSILDNNDKIINENYNVDEIQKILDKEKQNLTKLNIQK